MGPRRSRLDQVLVARGLATTRSRARDLILRGQVFVEGTACTRPASAISADLDVTVTSEADDVSRGAVKLRAALDAFAFDVGDRICLDVGASTGGFTQALLTAGAARVYAIDVGHGQLAARLATDPRVVDLQGHDIRQMTSANIADPIDAIVADVSFISLKKALPPALSFARSGSWLVALIKPQFEIGREDVGKGGIVRNADARDAAVQDISAWLAAQNGWSVTSVITSPIAGGSGNCEFLIGARHG